VAARVWEERRGRWLRDREDRGEGDARRGSESAGRDREVWEGVIFLLLLN